MRRTESPSATRGSRARHLGRQLRRIARDAVGRLRRSWSTAPRPPDATVEGLERIGDLLGALQAARAVVLRTPGDPSAVATLIRLATAWELWDEAAAVLRALPPDRREDSTIIAAEAALLSSMDEAHAALRLLDRALPSDPSSRLLREARFATLVDLNRLDEAEAELALADDADRARLDRRLAEARHDLDLLDARIREHAAARPNDPGRRAAVLMSTVRRIRLGVGPERWSTQHQREVDDLLAGYSDRPAVVRLGLAAAELTDDVALAERVLAAAPQEWRHAFLTAGHSWVAHHQGRPIEEVRALWSKLSAHNPVPQTRPCRPGELSPIGPPPPPSEPGEIVLFTVIRNEGWRLRWFLDTYRALGVTRFIFVDNGSTDGGDHLLLRERDVHLLRTGTSYALGRSGMVWVNELMRAYGSASWNLYVDVDELLVLPAIGDGRLPDTVRHLEEQGHEALAGQMIDMQAEPGTPPEQPEEELDFLGRYPFFDPHLTITGKLDCPYFTVHGGTRVSLNSHSDLTKTPIVRGGRGISFLSSSHRTSPAAVSPARCSLLHFKMVGDFRQQVIRDLEENRRRPACRRRYARYLEALDRLGDGGGSPHHLVRYEGPATLERLGLLVSPLPPAQT